MSEKRNTKEKICAFYASDYHFEMISLPYINKRIEKQDKIIILTQDNLEKTIETLLSKTNFKEEKKKEILKLDWKNNDIEKMQAIKSNAKQTKEMVIFIKGKENYIQKMNQNIEKWIPKENYPKIIDCYSVQEVGENLNHIMGQYQKVLGTTGEKEIEKI